MNTKTCLCYKFSMYWPINGGICAWNWNPILICLNIITHDSYLYCKETTIHISLLRVIFIDHNNKYLRFFWHQQRWFVFLFYTWKNTQPVHHNMISTIHYNTMAQSTQESLPMPIDEEIVLPNTQWHTSCRFVVHTNRHNIWKSRFITLGSSTVLFFIFNWNRPDRGGATAVGSVSSILWFTVQNNPVPVLVGLRIGGGVYGTDSDELYQSLLGDLNQLWYPLKLNEDCLQ